MRQLGQAELVFFSQLFAYSFFLPAHLSCCASFPSPFPSLSFFIMSLASSTSAATSRFLFSLLMPRNVRHLCTKLLTLSVDSFSRPLPGSKVPSCVHSKWPMVFLFLICMGVERGRGGGVRAGPSLMEL